MNPLPSVSELMVGIHAPYQETSPYLQTSNYSKSAIMYPRWPRSREILYPDINRAKVPSEPTLPQNTVHGKSVDNYDSSSSDSQNSISSPYTPREHRYNLVTEVVSLSPGDTQKNTSPSMAATDAKEPQMFFKSHNFPENLDRSIYGPPAFSVGQPDLRSASPIKAAPISRNESDSLYGPDSGRCLALNSRSEPHIDPLQRASFSHYPGLRNSYHSRVYPCLVPSVIWAPSGESYGAVLNTANNSHAILPSQFGPAPPMQYGYTGRQHDGQYYTGLVPVGMNLQPLAMDLLPRVNIETSHKHLEANHTTAEPNKRRTIRRRTRTGCLTCRKRRIKCDERKPHCFNCERSRKVCLGYERLQGGSQTVEDSEHAQQDLKDSDEK